jgi:hypothetical protein
MIEILRPGISELGFHAKVDGSGNLGIICTQGTAVASSDPLQQGPTIHVFENALRVIGKNYPGSDTTQIPDENHPPDPATDPNAKEATRSGQAWCIHPLPNVATGPGNGAANVIAIWALYPAAPNERAIQPYQAISAGDVECDAMGSTIICPSIGSSSAIAAHKATAALHGLAPATWKVEIEGFSGAAALFNGVWHLRLDQILGGQTVWRNQDHGDGFPLVELRCESPVPHVWRLSFRAKDAPSPSYERIADAWKALGPNVLALRPIPGLDAKCLPPSVTLRAG